MKNKIYKHIIILIVIVYLLPVYSLSMNKPFEPGENIIWKDDFESGEMKDWKVINEVTDEKPNWFIEKGYLIQDTDCGKTKELLGTNIINGSPEWHNYILRTNMVCADDDYIGVLFRFKDIDNYYRFLLSSQRRLICLEKKVNGEFIRLASFTDEEWQYVRFSVTIVLNESNIKVYLNDEPFFDVNDDQFSKGKIGFTSISNLGSFFDDVTVYSDYKIIPPVTKLKISRGPYLQNVLEDNAVIMWDTSIPVNSEVEYGLTKEETESIVDSLKTTKHEIKLDRLKQETVYYYRIKTGKLTGEWHSFKTAVKENTPFTFLAYGDTQLNFLRHNELTEQFIKHDFDFLINCGDVVQRGPRSDWDVEFFEPLKNILTNKPIYAAIGNHELNSENFYKNFANPNEEHENYYSFQYGNSFFIFIDNPRAGYPDREYYTDYRPGSDQYKWLEEQLASEKAQKAEWLFVVSHIPSYVAGSQEHYSGCKKHLVPLFEKYGVDVSFSGHVHGYERGEVNGVTYIITAGGGGAQNKPDPEKIKSYKDFKLVYNFCIIDINENTLSFKAFDKNNRGIDEFTVKH